MLTNHSYPANRIKEVKDYRKNGIPMTGSSSTSRNFGVDVLTTVNNPNYQIDIANHRDAGSNYYKRVEGSPSLLSCSGEGNVIGDKVNLYTGSIMIMPSTFGMVDYTTSVRPDLAVAKDQALKHVKNKLATKSGKFQTLVPLGEVRDLHRTYNSMTSLTTDFIMGALTAKKRIFKNPKRAVQDFTEFLSEAWLTYSFGISPTVADFEGLAESAAWRLARTHSIKETGGGSSSWVDNKSQDVHIVGNFPAGSAYYISVRCRSAHMYTVSYKYTAGRFIDLGIPNGYTVSDQFGLKWSEVIPAAYELIPFSWLLDYFTTAGDFVNDVFESPAGNTIYNYLTIAQKFSMSSSATIQYGNRFSGYASASSVPHQTGTIIRRTRLTQLPHQSLRTKTFSEISANASNKLLNLFSLAQPILGRRLR